MSATAAVKPVRKPFRTAWYAMSMARCVFPWPGLAERMRLRPSRTISGESAVPRSESLSVDWNVKSKSSTVLRNGNCAPRESRCSRVSCRCATSSATRTRRTWS